MDQKKLSDNIKIISSVLKAKYKNVDVESTVFGDLVVRGTAIASTAVEEEIEDKLKVFNFNSEMFDPNSVTEKELDDFAAVFNIVRKKGSKSYGLLLIETTANTDQTIPGGTKFSHGGFTYETTKAYNVKSNLSTVSGDDRFYYLIGSKYYFTLPVVATVEGRHEVNKDSVLTLISGTIANFSSAKAFSDFYPGFDKETNRELHERIKNYKVNVNPLSEESLRNFFNTYESVYKVYDLKVIGPNHVLSKRNQHWLFPISQGNKFDIYLKSVNKYFTKREIFICELIEIVDASTSRWKVTFTKNNVPNFLKVEKINYITDSTLLNVYSYTSYIDLTDESHIPDLVNFKESRFSRYSKTEVVFTDNIRPTASMSVGDKDLYVIEYISFDEMVNFHNVFYEKYNLPFDSLLKFCNFCFVTTTATLSTSSTDKDVKTIIEDFINNLSLGTPLTTTALIEVILSNTKNTTITSFNISGEIFKSNNTTVTISGPNLLIPTDADNFLHQDNTAYISKQINLTII